jgi:hypothetical protein
VASRARRNLFMSTTLMSFLLAAAFTVHDGVHWFWSDRPWVAGLLLVLGVVLALLWARAQRDLKGPSV